MSMFILAISCLTTSNLLWFTDLTFQVSIHVVLYSIRLAFHHQPQPQPQLRVITALGQMLLSFWYFFLAILVNVRPSPSVAYWTSSILGEGARLPESCLSAFSYCSWGFHGKNTGVGCHSLLWWSSVRTLHRDSPVLGGPAQHHDSPVLGSPAPHGHSLRYTSPSTMTRRWSMKGDKLIPSFKMGYCFICRNSKFIILRENIFISIALSYANDAISFICT